jgi:HNH endonuclease
MSLQMVIGQKTKILMELPAKAKSGTYKRGLTLEERFWAKVDKSDGCWNWNGCLNEHGYGLFGINNRSKLAHRIAYKITIKDPDNLCVLHKCDNPKCVNPAHLFLGTKKENTQDMLKKGRDYKPVGERSTTSKLTISDVVLIRQLLSKRARGDVKRVAEKFKISKRHAYGIAAGETWSHLQ